MIDTSAVSTVRMMRRARRPSFPAVRTCLHLSFLTTRNLQTAPDPILFSSLGVGGIAVRFVLVLILGLSFSNPVLAQTPAETNLEARHISQNHGVPQLNGRLLLPGSGYEEISVREQLGAINLAWRKYSASFRIPEKGLRDLVPYFKRNPDLFRQLLAQHTRATPEVIDQIIKDDINKVRVRLSGSPQKYGLDEFDTYALGQAMEQTVAAIRHTPSTDRIPVTILTPAFFGSYNFERKGFHVKVELKKQWFLKEHWYLTKVIADKRLQPITAFVPYPIEQAQDLARALDVSSFGANRFFAAFEADVSVLTGDVEIYKAIFAADPTLTQRFYERDFVAEKSARAAAKAEARAQAEAEKRAKQEAEARAEAERKRKLQEALEKRLAEQAEAEASGYERDALAPVYETAGLVLGAPPPEGHGFRRHDWFGRSYPLPAFKAFFHTEMPGEELAFLTSDGTLAGDIVFLARAFKGDEMSEEELMQSFVQKIGKPSSMQGKRSAFWWSSSVPSERRASCRLYITHIGLGHANQRNGGWSRNPIEVDPNMFKADCGLIANLDVWDGRYAAADTTYFNSELLKALDAQSSTQAE